MAKGHPAAVPALIENRFSVHTRDTQNAGMTVWLNTGDVIAPKQEGLASNGSLRRVGQEAAAALDIASADAATFVGKSAATTVKDTKGSAGDEPASRP